MCASHPPEPGPSLFNAGVVAHTRAALDALEAAGVSTRRPAGTMPAREYLDRHLAGDFGDVDDELREANLSAIECGQRVYSVYRLPTGQRLWIITEAEVSTMLRPRTTVTVELVYATGEE